LLRNFVEHRLADRGIVKSEVLRATKAFAITSTLDDQLEDRAIDLFRLGQYLVWLNWPDIQEVLDANTAQK
jgi:hypothetical protein